MPLGIEAADLYYQMTSALILCAAENFIMLGNNYSSIGPVNHVSLLSDFMYQTALYAVTTSKNLGIFKRILLNNSPVHSCLYTFPKKETHTYPCNPHFCHGEVLYFVTDYTETYVITAPFMIPLKSSLMMKLQIVKSLTYMCIPVKVKPVFMQ